MLDVIKEVLIKQKQDELNQREVIDKRIKEIKKEECQENFEVIDRELGEIEKELLSLNIGFFKRLFNGKKIKRLYEKYASLSHSKMDKINKFNNERDELLSRLYDVSHNEVLIEKEMEKIQKASSLAELDMTEEEAMDLLKEYFENDNLAIIKTVFSNIKNNKNIMTREDIFKNMQELYQTNISSFVTAMKKVVPKDFVSALLDVGIVIDEDKVSFLNSLTSYILEPSGNISAVVGKLGRSDRLDSYYYNEIEKALSKMQTYGNFPSSHLSYIMSLSALVSMAKTNKLEKENKK